MVNAVKVLMQFIAKIHKSYYALAELSFKSIKLLFKTLLYIFLETLQALHLRYLNLTLFTNSSGGEPTSIKLKARSRVYYQILWLLIYFSYLL